MSEITWTPEELSEFDQLCDETGSRNQVTRISARLRMREFVQKHGQEKCNAMWAHLEGPAKNNQGE